MSRKKVSSNEPCPCGSGKKYKHCCYPKDNMSPASVIEYPLGTVALYGPDDKTTTKITAGVLLHRGAEPILERWVATDVTTNPKVGHEMNAFFHRYGVKSVVKVEGNIGCPHEEGADFPVGGDCPFCPFWKGKQGSGATRT